MTPALIKENLKGMEDLATAIVVCDKELIIKYINPSAEILFELSHGHVVNEYINLFFEDIDFFKDALIQAKTKRSSYREHEYFIKTKQNKTICVSFTITSIEQNRGFSNGAFAEWSSHFLAIRCQIVPFAVNPCNSL